MSFNCAVMQIPTTGSSSIKNYHVKMFYQNINLTVAYSEDLSEMHSCEVSLNYLVMQFSKSSTNNTNTNNVNVL